MQAKAMLNHAAMHHYRIKVQQEAFVAAVAAEDARLTNEEWAEKLRVEGITWPPK